MKNKKIYILFLLALFSLLFINIFSFKVSANTTGIVPDNGSTGLWHEMIEENQEFKAYVYMRFYYSWTPNLTKQTLKDDHSNTNPSMIANSTQLGTAVRFDYPNTDFLDNYKTARTISAPTGFDTLHIKNVNSTDGSLTNVYVGTTKNIEISLFALYDVGSSTKNDLIITNLENNQIIYQHKAIDKLFVIYWTGQEITPPDYGDDPVENVGSDYTQIPLLNRNFIQIDKTEVLSADTNTHKFYLNINFVLYSFDMSFPSDINIDDYKLDNGKLNMSYSSFKEERYLYLQPDKTKKPYPLQHGTIENPSDLMVGFISINITDPTNITFDRVQKLEIDTIIAKEFNSNAYMYVFFPLEIQDILNIHVKYTYRLKYFGVSGDWQTVNNMYAWNETASVNASWWMYLGPLTAFAAYGSLFNVFDIKSIQNIQTNDLSNYVKDTFYNQFNGTEEELVNSTKYKIHLGQFSKVGSTGYDFQNNYEILELTYMYKGQIYNVDYKNIDHTGSTPDYRDGLDFNGFFAFEGVNDVSTCLNHLINYWQETLVSLVIFILALLFIAIVVNIIRFVKPKTYYRKW